MVSVLRGRWMSWLKPLRGQLSPARMARRLDRRWKRWRLWSAMLLVMVVLIPGVLAGGYLLRWNGSAAWEWTGVIRRDKSDHWEAGKTLWDMVQLLILPLALATVGVWFSARQKNTELAIEDERQQDTALENYLEKMSDLLINKHLGEASDGDPVRAVARAWTLTILPRMTPRRKRQIVRFLSESRLGRKSQKVKTTQQPIISLLAADLNTADLRGLYLKGAVLEHAHLRGAHLERAKLIQANLKNADLSEAHLSGADLTGATVDEEQLRRAHCLKGTVMKDGTKFTTWKEWDRRKGDQVAEKAGVAAKGQQI